MVVAVLVLAAAGVVVARAERPLAGPTVHTSLASSMTVPGHGPSLPWPAQGQSAVRVPALGYAASSGPDTPVPIASLTKVTTAVLVLHDHPLAPGDDGPSLTMTPADVAQYQEFNEDDQSTVAVQAGEVLTERQLLEGLLIRSANNFAAALAVWDAGSVPAFVAKMNGAAALLGMSATHYADASGYDPASVSSAVDCLKIAAVGMADPTFAAIVAMPSVTLPGVGTLPNIVTLVGRDGVVGVKSGYTSAAGGNLVLATVRTVAGRQVLVLAAAVGQRYPPPSATPPPTTATTQPAGAAGPAASTTTTTTTTVPPPPGADDVTGLQPLAYTAVEASALLNAASAAVVSVPVARTGTVVATAHATWGGTDHVAGVVTTDDAVLPALPGQTVAVSRAVAVVPGARAGQPAGAVVYRLGTERVTVPLRLTAPVREPSFWWRLTHQ